MSWAPADLVSDVDLVAYEARVLEVFGKVNWAEKRATALEKQRRRFSLVRHE